VAVPYAFKLLMQELLAMNIRMSIITDDNISQIENMGFSKSIEKLMFIPNAVPKTVIDKTREILEDKTEKQKHVSISNKEFSLRPPSPHTPDNSPPIRPKYIPHTPDYTPPNSPIFSEGLSLGYKEKPDSPNEPPPGYYKETDSPNEPPPGYYKETDSPDEPPLGYGTESYSPDEPTIIKTGGKVHYRGDHNPSRLWTVQHMGSSYYTIDTDDSNGLSTEDTIKIVKPEDIYNIDESNIYSVPTVVEQPSNYIPLDSNTPYLSSNPDSKLNFAPVIKIFNHGNDMSQPGESNPEVGFPTNIGGNNEFINVPSIIEKDNHNEDKNVIDFSKPMIIKKM